MKALIFFITLIFTSPIFAEYFSDDIGTIDGLNLNDMSKVYGTALQDLYEKSLNPIEPDKLIASSFKGFNQFLPGIRAIDGGDSILLQYDKKVIGNFRSPSDRKDMQAWGELISAMLVNIRNNNPKLLKSHPEQLYYQTLSVMATTVDPYAQYLPPKQAMTKTGSASLISTSIGISYRRDKNKNIQVLSVFQNSPAFLKGLSDGDTITKIHGKEVAKMFDEEVESYFHGRTNAFVPITYVDFLSRQTKDVVLRRTTFVASPIDIKILSGGFAHLIIHDFSINTKELVQEAVIHAYNSNDELYGLILDLRGNSGGLLDQGVEIADMFMDSGMIVETKGRHESANKKYSAKKGDLLNGRPIVVLVDQTTASSAEVLALSLQQSGRAVVIGTPTMGKGAVQTASDLPNGGKLIFSWAKVYDKDGNFLDGRGVLPVICTSSIKNIQAEFDMIENIRSKKFKSPILDWQHLPETKMEEIKLIRAGCKPSDLTEENIAFTQNLALSILNDKEIYKKLINIQTKGE